MEKALFKETVTLKQQTICVVSSFGLSIRLLIGVCMTQDLFN